MISALCFDFGNVLATFSHERACEQLARLTKGRHGAGDFRTWIFDTGRHKQLEEGTLHPDDFIAGLQAEFRLDTASRPAIVRAWTDMFGRIESTCRLIARLPAELPLFLASNTDPLHFEHFAPLFGDVFARFRLLVRSYDVGARKPARAFFEYLVARTGKPAHECLFIDDMEENVSAAREVGLRGIVFGPSVHLESELRGHGLAIATS